MKVTAFVTYGLNIINDRISQESKLEKLRLSWVHVEQGISIKCVFKETLK